MGSPEPKNLALPSPGSGMTQARSIATCVTRVLVPESGAFSYGRLNEGGGEPWDALAPAAAAVAVEAARAARATSRLLCTTAARAAKSREPGSLARSRGAGDSRHPAGPSTPELGPPEQRLEPAGALRQGRRGRQQEPPELWPVLGPGIARAPKWSRNLARPPGRDCRGACGPGHGPGTPLAGYTGTGPWPRAIADDRPGRGRVRLACRCAKLAARKPA